MSLIRSSLACVVLLSALSPTKCPPNNPTGDKTPPGFLEVLVRLEKPGDPNARGEFNITSQSFTRSNLSPDLKIHIFATAGDSESGIKRIELATNSDLIGGAPYNLLFKCYSGLLSELTGPTGILSPFKLSNPPSPPPTIWQIDAVADPIAATGCPIKPNGAGPINIGGFIRLLVTNGVGQTTQSGTFVFAYADVGGK
jgi:hypothetical protein